MGEVGPFSDYPDFNDVIDEISEDGFQVHYNSIRLLYADKGKMWKRKWEPTISRWEILANNWIKLMQIIRKHNNDDILLTKILSDEIHEDEFRSYLKRVYYTMITLNDVVDIKKQLIIKSRSKDTKTKDFISTFIKDFNKDRLIKNTKAFENQAQIIVDSFKNYTKKIEKIKPVMNIGDIEVKTYSMFKDCVFSLKEIIETLETVLLFNV